MEEGVQLVDAAAREKFETIIGVRKSVHIQLGVDAHRELRIKLKQMNLTMQDIFDEFSQLVITDDIRAESILNDLLERKAVHYVNDPSNNYIDAQKLLDYLENEAKK